jgi:hypothetical protein
VKRLLVIAAATAVAAGTGLGTTALAASPSPARSVGHSGEIRGVVPSKAAAKTAGSGGNLVNHGGPVMTTNRTVAIYWVPGGYSVSTGYESIINRFFTDVAHDSGLSTNVYYSDTQYSGIQYSSTVGATIVDTNPFPSSGCSDNVSQTSICLSDAQLRNEIAAVGSAYANSSTMFFMFTPLGVGSCYNSSSCAFSQYCAYHSNFSSGGKTYIYANQPYTETVDAACGSGKSPNGDAAADSTINVVSHEHNEAITDTFGTAWYDRRGYENGDKCAWNFGSSTALTYNQTINTNHYYLQQEWSNHSSGCVLTGI